MAKSQLIFGKHPVLDAIKSGEQIDKVMLLQGTRGELEIELRKLCRERHIPIVMTPQRKLDFIVKGKNHQNVVAFISPIRFQNIEDIVPHVFEKGEVPLFLILDGITDTRNFGAIVRSAEVFGVHAIIVPMRGSAKIGADAMKTSAGALLNIPICKTNSLVNTITFLRNSGIQVYASDLKAKKTIDELDFKDPVALVIGSEDEGTSHAVLTRTNANFLIPQLGKTDSLNVSVSAGVMLYEAQRQRK